VKDDWTEKKPDRPEQMRSGFVRKMWHFVVSSLKELC
jgi:hypothetical protein